MLFGLADSSTWHVFAEIGDIFLIAGMWTPATGILIADRRVLDRMVPVSFKVAGRKGARICCRFVGWRRDARPRRHRSTRAFLAGSASMLMGEGEGKHTSKEARMALYIKGHDRDRSGDDSIAEKPDNLN
jgi:hypothetical protein